MECQRLFGVGEESVEGSADGGEGGGGSAGEGSGDNTKGGQEITLD